MREKTKSSGKAFFRPSEAATLLSLGLTTVYKLINSGDLVAYKQSGPETVKPRITLITRASIVRYMRTLSPYNSNEQSHRKLETCPFCGAETDFALDIEAASLFDQTGGSI